MRTATVKELKTELQSLPPEDLVKLNLRLSKFKKENKELLTYLLFEASDEDNFVDGVKEEISQTFTEINTSSIFFIKKTVRKILRNTKKYIRYSDEKKTEVELLIYFCKELKGIQPSFNKSSTLQNIYNTQLNMAKKKLSALHEDLQYDYETEIEAL